MQAEHQRTTDLIAQLAVGLGPVPHLTHPDREGAAAQAGMIGDELPQEGDVCRPDLAATKAEEDVRPGRAGYRRRVQTLPFCAGTEGKVQG